MRGRAASDKNQAIVADPSRARLGQAGDDEGRALIDVSSLATSSLQ